MLFVLSIIVLASCSNPLAEKQASSSSIAPIEEVGTVAEVEVVEEVARATMPDADFYGNKYDCNSLKVAENRANCERQVADLIGSFLQSEIMESFDIKRCIELPENLADSCTERLNATNVHGPVTVEEMLVFAEIMRGDSPTAEEDKSSKLMGGEVFDKIKCMELKTPGYKEYCEAQINVRMDSQLLDDVMRLGDSARCDEIKTESFQIMCKHFFEPTVIDEAV